MVSILLCLYCLFVFVPPLKAVDPPGSTDKYSLQTVIRSLYHFKFIEADSIIQQLEKNYPDDYIPTMARANYLWWYMISQPADNAIRNEYTRYLEHAEHLLSKAYSSSPADEELFFLIHVYAYRLRLELMHGGYLKAYRNVYQAMKHIGASLGREGRYPAFLLTSGLYNYLTEHIKLNYPLFRISLLMHPRGNMSLGIKQLQMAADQDDEVLHTEARYFLMRIYLDLEDRPDKALYYASLLTNSYPENLIYLYYHHHIASVLAMADLVSALEKKFFEALDANHELNAEQQQYLISLLQP